MSLSLPPSDSPLRELFDVADLVNVRTLPTFAEARRGARRFLHAEPAAREVHSIVHRTDGQIWLVRFGPHDGWRRLWNFSR